MVSGEMIGCRLGEIHDRKNGREESHQTQRNASQAGGGPPRGGPLCCVTTCVVLCPRVPQHVRLWHVVLLCCRGVSSSAVPCRGVLHGNGTPVACVLQRKPCYVAQEYREDTVFTPQPAPVFLYGHRAGLTRPPTHNQPQLTLPRKEEAPKRHRKGFEPKQNQQVGEGGAWRMPLVEEEGGGMAARQRSKCWVPPEHEDTSCAPPLRLQASLVLFRRIVLVVLAVSIHSFLFCISLTSHTWLLLCISSLKEEAILLGSGTYHSIMKTSPSPVRKGRERKASHGGSRAACQILSLSGLQQHRRVLKQATSSAPS